MWTGTSSCCFSILDKLQKQICRTVVPSFTAYLEHLAHRQNVAIFSLFFRYLVEIHLKWQNWFHLLILMAGTLIIQISCMISLWLFLDVIRMSVSPRTARLLNSLPVEWFLLTFDLNCFKSAVNTHLLSNQLSYILFLYFSPFSPFSCSSMPCSGYPALHGAKPN